ncbi:MAG: hypothetical protein AAGB26_03310 [Planctomycetota bacterium]
MAHFLTVVFVESNEADPTNAGEQLLRPYFARDMADSPDAKCDGFVVGGRYDGDIWGKEQHYDLTPAEYQARYGLDVVSPEDNVCPVSVLRPGLLPFAAITPDGQWQDCEGKSESQWQAEWSNLLEHFGDHLAVGIDCHC